MKEQENAKKKTTIVIQRMKNIFSTKEFISTLFTGLICTVISLGITSCIEKKNREINLYPYLEIAPSKVSYRDGYFGLVVRNTGKGPAIIEGGHLEANSKIYVKDITNNIWNKFLPELGIYSETFNQIWDTNTVAQKNFKANGLSKDNACKLFFAFDYIPTIHSSIKDGEDLALISFPTQYTDSNIGRKEPDNEIFHKMYQECRTAFENMISLGKFNIKLEYKSLNGNKYETERRIKFSF